MDHLLVDHVDLVNRDLPSWVHAHIYATHLLDFLGEKRHPKVATLALCPGTCCAVAAQGSASSLAGQRAGCMAESAL